MDWLPGIEDRFGHFLEVDVLRITGDSHVPSVARVTQAAPY
jgi:hypothetical protein